MLTRMIPNGLETSPCSVVALHCALLHGFGFDEFKIIIHIDENGYCSLKDMNKAVRQNFKVGRYVYFKKSERKKLNKFVLHYSFVKNLKAIVCVKGHYIYLDSEKYYSYFDNENDEVVAVWFLEDAL